MMRIPNWDQLEDLPLFRTQTLTRAQATDLADAYRPAPPPEPETEARFRIHFILHRVPGRLSEACEWCRT